MYHQKLTDTQEDQLSLAAVHFLRSHYQEASWPLACFFAPIATQCWSCAHAGDGHLQAPAAGQPRRPGFERLCGHVLLQAGLLRCLARDPGGLPPGKLTAASRPSCLGPCLTLISIHRFLPWSAFIPSAGTWPRQSPRYQATRLIAFPLACAGLPRLVRGREPQGLQQLPPVQRQGRRSGAQGARRSGLGGGRLFCHTWFEPSLNVIQSPLSSPERHG
jgi:hypothetical protein